VAFRVVFAESVAGELLALKAAERARVLEAVARRLVHQPLVAVAPWELRVGRLRVFYEIASDEPALVRILAVGKKEGGVLRIGGKEIKL
jgi:hypothetical protein